MQSTKSTCTFMKVALKTVYLEIIAMSHVLATVKPTRVMYRMVPVLDVSLDGQELRVTQVSKLNICWLTKQIRQTLLMS